MIKVICVSYLLGSSHIDLRTIKYITRKNLGIKVAVLFYSPGSFHTKEDLIFFNESYGPQVLLFIASIIPQTPAFLNSVVIYAKCIANVLLFCGFLSHFTYLITYFQDLEGLAFLYKKLEK